MSERDDYHSLGVGLSSMVDDLFAVKSGEMGSASVVEYKKTFTWEGQEYHLTLMTLADAIADGVAEAGHE